MTDWKPVARALLGSWPSQVSGWGQEGIAAYIEELEARGLDPEAALIAIRSWPAGSDFPPSAPNLAAEARKDPDTPTFAELFLLIYGPRGVLRARPPYTDGEYEYSHDEAAERKARTLHPVAAGFILQERIANLRMLEVDHDERGGLVRRDLESRWDKYRDVNASRELAALTRSGRGLKQLGDDDWLAQIESGFKPF